MALLNLLSFFSPCINILINYDEVPLEKKVRLSTAANKIYLKERMEDD